MNRLGTSLAIRRSIMAVLEWWLQLTQQEYCPKALGFGSISGADVWSTNAYAEQTGLGRGQLLRGPVSTLWRDAFVKESGSSKPKEAHGKWTKQVIKLFWQLALDIWDHRNAELHGRTLEQQQEKQMREITTKVKEFYRNFGINPLCIHSSAHYLFDLPQGAMLRKPRQYLLCWIRSVEVAIQYQEAETNILRDQADRFFGALSRRAQDGAALTTISRATLPEADIAFPERYNLRRRRRGTQAQDLSTTIAMSQLYPRRCLTSIATVATVSVAKEMSQTRRILLWQYTRLLSCY